MKCTDKQKRRRKTNTAARTAALLLTVVFFSGAGAAGAYFLDKSPENQLLDYEGQNYRQSIWQGTFFAQDLCVAAENVALDGFADEDSLHAAGLFDINNRQVVYYVKKLIGWSYLMMGVCNLLILLFVNQLIGLYSGLSPETVALARSLVVLHCSFAILMWPVAFVLPSALRAANDVKFTMWVGVGSMLVFRVFGSWLLCVQMEMGAMGVWIAMILDWVCRIAFYLPRMISGKWKSKYRPT